MRRFGSSLIIGLFFALAPFRALADVVIWSGDDAEFLNSGSIIVPGISTGGGVCTIDGTGKFANGSINDILPSQTSNNGKFLQTNGTSVAWAAASGSGTVTNVSSGDGSLDITNPTTTPDVRLHFPISAPNGTNFAPSYRFDSDTGMYSTGDGNLSWATNNVLACSIDNNQRLACTSSITASDFIYPAKAANTFLAGPTTGSAVPSFRQIQPGDLTYDDIPFPLNAPIGSNSAPSYNFDSDTGMYSTGDGNLSFSTNAVKALDISNGQQATFTNTVTATDFIYPAKSANTFLAGPTSGSAVPNFRVIQPGDLTYDDIPFPLNAPGGSNSAPSYNFDSDTGMYSPGDGIIGFSTNGVKRCTFENNGDVDCPGTINLSFTGDATFTGNISAANYPPTNSANTLAWFNNTGVLDSLGAWSVDPTTFSLTSIISDSSTVSDYWQIRTQTNLNGTYSANARALWMALDGGGTVDTVIVGDLGNNVPSVGNSYLLSLSNSSSSVGNVGYGLSIDFQSPITSDLIMENLHANNSVGGNFYGFNLFDETNVTNNSNLVNVYSAGTSGNGRNFFSAGNGGAITGQFYALNAYNNGTVSDWAYGAVISQNADVTKGMIGFNTFLNANMGDGSGVNYTGFNVNTSSGHTVDGNMNGLAMSNQATVTQGIQGVSINNSGTQAGITGLSLFNSGSMTGNNNFNGMQVNQSAAGYRFVGASASNSANQSEEIRGFQLNSTGDARTGTGLDITYNGNFTDDVQGIRVNMGSATSTNSRPSSMQLEGGVASVQSQYTPKSGANVDIGNNLTATGTVQSGFPLTGTDQIIQLIQSNLLVQDDIATGPFGLDTNMLGLVSQVAVDSGKTVPLLRSALIGTSVPAGSGGTITEHHVIEILGFPSFGGSLSNPTRVGLIDSNLLGQNFCDGATDCWFIKNQDGNAENSLNRLAINTTSKKVSSSSVGLEINDKHVKVTQATPPTATVQASAGTGATCTASGDTDTAGQISITTGTIGISTGSYCKLNFNAAYGVAPVCVLTPASSTISTSVYVTSTTADMDVNFAVAGGISSNYVVNYYCLETQ